jgi:hypothetical protein
MMERNVREASFGRSAPLEEKTQDADQKGGKRNGQTETSYRKTSHRNLGGFDAVLVR